MTARYTGPIDMERPNDLILYMGTTVGPFDWDKLMPWTAKKEDPKREYGTIMQFTSNSTERAIAWGTKDRVSTAADIPRAKWTFLVPMQSLPYTSPGPLLRFSDETPPRVSLNVGPHMFASTITLAESTEFVPNPKASDEANAKAKELYDAEPLMWILSEPVKAKFRPKPVNDPIDAQCRVCTRQAQIKCPCDAARYYCSPEHRTFDWHNQHRQVCSERIRGTPDEGPDISPEEQKKLITGYEKKLEAQKNKFAPDMVQAEQEYKAAKVKYEATIREIQTAQDSGLKPILKEAIGAMHEMFVKVKAETANIDQIRQDLYDFWRPVMQKIYRAFVKRDTFLREALGMLGKREPLKEFQSSMENILVHAAR